MSAVLTPRDSTPTPGRRETARFEEPIGADPVYGIGRIVGRTRQFGTRVTTHYSIPCPVCHGSDSDQASPSSFFGEEIEVIDRYPRETAANTSVYDGHDTRIVSLTRRSCLQCERGERLVREEAERREEERRQHPLHRISRQYEATFDVTIGAEEGQQFFEQLRDMTDHAVFTLPPAAQIRMVPPRCALTEQERAFSKAYECELAARRATGSEDAHVLWSIAADAYEEEEQWTCADRCVRIAAALVAEAGAVVDLDAPGRPRR